MQLPTAGQLAGAERQALCAQLPALSAALDRISQSYLGTEIHLGAPKLVWQRPELSQLSGADGPTLVTEFGQAGRLVTKVTQSLAERCVTALLGYPAPVDQPSPGLTDVDLAILRPYLESLAAAVVRTLFHSHGPHHLFRAQQAAQLSDEGEAFALVFPLEAGAATGTLVLTAPVIAYRARRADEAQAGQPALDLRQVEQAPVRLGAVLPALSLSLIEVATMEPGDVVPLPQGKEMLVHLQAGDCLVAAGRAGTQGGRLGIRLLKTQVAEDTESAMKDDLTQQQHSATDAAPQEAVSQLHAQSQGGLEALSAIPVDIQIRLGEVSLPLAELLALRAGSVVALNKDLGEPVEVLAGDKVVACGEIVAVGDQLGVRILELADAEQA